MGLAGASNDALAKTKTDYEGVVCSMKNAVIRCSMRRLQQAGAVSAGLPRLSQTDVTSPVSNFQHTCVRWHRFSNVLNTPWHYYPTFLSLQPFWQTRTT